MDGSSVSVLWYRRSKPQGKVRQRVRDLRTPSLCYSDPVPVRTVLDLSHNESARLAMDCLLTQGLEEYYQVLKAEGEADFLSEMEKKYILENGKESNTAVLSVSDDNDYIVVESLSAGSQSSAAVSTGESAACKPMKRDEKCPGSDLGEPRVELYFQSDNRAAGMKDLVRQFIRKAKMTLAIVMDSFTDTELLCDLLEASGKRNVSVHLLLDHLNLNMFVTMWQDLKLSSKKFPKMSVRSVDGQTYCTKTGIKLTGQITESFIITDWTEVLTGSYSFSWLSWQVHRSLAVLLKGSAVTQFHQEFYRLYSSSKPVPCFVPVPHDLSLYITSHVAQNDKAGVSESESSRTKTAGLWSWTEDTQPTAKTPVLVKLKSLEMECTKGGDHGAGTHAQSPTSCPKPLLQQLSNSVAQPENTVSNVSTRHDAKKHMEKNQKQIQHRSKTCVSYSQLQPAIFNITTTTGRNATGHESNPVHTFKQQSTLRNASFDCDTLGIERLFIQQRNRDRLKLSGVTAYLSAVRRQWNSSFNLKPKMELQSDNPKAPLCLHQCSLTNASTIHTSGLQTKVSALGMWRQERCRTNQKIPTDTSYSKMALRATGIQPEPQLRTKFISRGTRAKLNLPPHTSHHMNPPQRLNWILHIHTVRPRPVARSSSFNTMDVTGQRTGGQPGCRPTLSHLTTSLRRSKSWTGKRSTGFKRHDYIQT